MQLEWNRCYHIIVIHMSNVYRHKGSCQKRFSGFFPLRGYPTVLWTEDNFVFGQI